MVDFEAEVKATISNSINYEQQILNFIKKLDITSIADLKQNNLSDQLVYQNFNNLSLQIQKNKMLADSLTYKKFDHNPFFEEASKPIPLYKYSKLLFSLFGLSLGFLLSLIIIYFKNLKVIL
jgi:pilus assembly protein TadC